MAGQVYVGDRLVDKPGTLIQLDADCRVAEATPELKYVSRGGLKLEKALDTFELNPAGLIAIDVGASTGGFTQCLLEHGAQRVYAIDVGYGQLAWELRNDPRIVVMERTNIRHLQSLPEAMQCAVIDVSFISLRLVLPALVPLLLRHWKHGSSPWSSHNSKQVRQKPTVAEGSSVILRYIAAFCRNYKSGFLCILP